MPEASLHQTTGLHELLIQPAQHVIVIASNGDWQGELPLLWNLCSAWSSMGYTLAVLDATTPESDSNPGLQQLMNNMRLPASASFDQVNWAIVPAGIGLPLLSENLPPNDTASPLQTLSQLFDDYEIILIYASAQNLAACLPDTGLEPLLPLSINTLSIVPAYQALKLLMQKGHLHATTVTVVDTSNPMDLLSALHVNHRLQDCAFNFLGQHIATLTAPCQPLNELEADDIKTLALRLLERAVSLRPDTIALAQAKAISSVPPATARKH